MTEAEVQVLSQLREDLQKDIKLAIANFKIWLLLTVLSNVFLIGVPALYVFFSTQNQAQTALTMANEDRKRIDANEKRLTAIEQHLIARDSFKTPYTD